MDGELLDSVRRVGSWVDSARRWARAGRAARQRQEPVIGLALGGGFARGIAHLGVLSVLEEEKIPIHCLAGVSAGAMVAAAYASGASIAEIEVMARSMRFRDVARWTVNRLGLVTSERMNSFLKRLLKVYTFEQMRIPMAVVATDLESGDPRLFRGRGDVILPIRASCSYPGLFLPIRWGDRHLVDGAISMDVPARAAREMGATHVVSVSLEAGGVGFDPQNMLNVVNRCIQILQERTQADWRSVSSVVIEPEVAGFGWDGFDGAGQMMEAGRQAARLALPQIRSLLEPPQEDAATRGADARPARRLSLRR